ncbi:MAG: BMP family ABC transporter substrate-binding protein [Mogibacterium sp.]|nr:BMP family ABC transporter substrate-binding protein [Mogibacterium sp.]MBQ6500369.1 BMP family ABC transporter substrate-binding protein [Mogibacterium sp.]
MIMKKRLIALLVCLVMVMMPMLAACGGGGGGEEAPAGDEGGAAMKVGLITLHDENSTYDKNFLDSFQESCDKMGVEAIIMKNVPEGQECYDAAGELVDKGCTLIFSDSFGHQGFMLQAAKDNPDVQFVSCTGDNALVANQDNFHNAFASIYEGRFLAGVAAGMKLNEIKEAGKLKGDVPKMGYVGAFTYAEVVSGYTSFYLGAKSVCPDVVMDVTFTGSWYDETAEKEGANKLIQGGADLISQHADSMGAPTACKEAGIPDVSYNGSTMEACPDSYIISSKINWSPFYEYAIAAVQKGEAFDTNWTGTLDTGSVQLTELNENVAAEGTAAKLEEVEAGLKDGSIHVFDTSTFTVDGKTLDSYKADVEADEAYEHETEVISDGYFHESEYRSAPYFDLQIDGINLLDTNFG